MKDFIFYYQADENFQENNCELFYNNNINNSDNYIKKDKDNDNVKQECYLNKNTIKGK